MSLTNRWLAIGTGLALGAAACGGGGGGVTGPATLSDPVATAANLDTVAQPFSTPQFQSFSAVADKFPLAAAGTSMQKLAALLAATRPDLPTTSALPYARSAQRAEALRRVLPFHTNASSNSIFPPGVVLGTVYVWNAASGGYVAGGSGGPTNGVRFILYAIDAGTGLPSSPLTQIGYVDLTDKSSGGTTSLGVTIVGTTGASAVTYVDYTISGTFTTTSATARLLGYVTDGKTRLDFDVSISGNESPSGGTFTFTSKLDVTAKNIHIVFNLGVTSSSTATSTTITETPDFSLTIGSETVTAKGTVTFTITQTAATISGSIAVKVNGADFATITITLPNLILTGAGGRALTQDERNVLDRIFAVPEVFLSGLGDLFAPAEIIFGFSLP